MRHAQISRPRRVGTAPGTTVLQINGQPVAGLSRHASGAIYPTQSVWEPDPNSDTVKISMPPNQWATGPTEMVVRVPAGQNRMGPVITDQQAARSLPYLPVRKGWIAGKQQNVFHLQGSGGLGEMSSSEKWAITASVISAFALATSTMLAVLRYKKGR